MTQSISIQHHVRAGEIAAFIRQECRSGVADTITYAALTRRFAISDTSLKAAFRQRYRTSLHAFVIAEKMRYVAELLESTELSLKAIAIMLGYTERSNFGRDFTKYFGVSPARWRKKTLCPTAAFELIG